MSAVLRVVSNVIGWSMMVGLVIQAGLNLWRGQINEASTAAGIAAILFALLVTKP